MKQAITELNEHYSPCVKTTGDKKEKDMSDKHCLEYNQLVRDILALAEPVGYDVLINPDATLTVTRKKPKVKVDYRQLRSFFFGRYGEEEGYGDFYVVQFKVTGWDGRRAYLSDYRSTLDASLPRDVKISADYPHTFFYSPCDTGMLHLGFDARDKWSHPVLLPEGVYNKLPEIVKALEEKANEVKG